MNLHSHVWSDKNIVFFIGKACKIIGKIDREIIQEFRFFSIVDSDDNNNVREVQDEGNVKRKWAG